MMALSFQHLNAQKLQVLTEVWAPYNFIENDKPVGLSTELVKAVLQRANIDYELKILPWKRAYLYALNQPNTLIFTITKTRAREKIFKWIGPIYPRKAYFYKLKNRTDIKVKNFEDLKKYHIGVLDGGNTQASLIEKGFENNVNLFSVINAKQNILKLFKGRIDFTIGSDAKFIFQLKNSEFKFENLEKSILLSDEYSYYLAANINTPDDVVNKLQTALDQLISEGVRDDIWRKHMGNIKFEWSQE